MIGVLVVVFLVELYVFLQMQMTFFDRKFAKVLLIIETPLIAPMTVTNTVFEALFHMITRCFHLAPPPSPLGGTATMTLCMRSWNSFKSTSTPVTAKSRYSSLKSSKHSPPVVYCHLLPSLGLQRRQESLFLVLMDCRHFWSVASALTLFPSSKTQSPFSSPLFRPPLPSPCHEQSIPLSSWPFPAPCCSSRRVGECRFQFSTRRVNNLW